MTILTCSGYTLFQGNLSVQQFTDQSVLFSTQTLAQVNTIDVDTIQVVCTGLNIKQVLPDTLLEQLAWLLFNAPDCDAIMRPLYRCMHNDPAVTITSYHSAELNPLIDEGVITVLRYNSNDQITSVTQSARDRLRTVISSQQCIQVLSKALFEPDNEIVSSPPQRSFSHYLQIAINGKRKIISWLKQQLTLEQKIWIKQRGISTLGYLGSRYNTITEEAHSLARLKSWPSFTIRSQFTLQASKPADTRIAVLLAVHWLELGGAEKFVVDLIRALPKDSYKIYVTTAVISKNSWATLIEDEVEALFYLPDFLQADMFGYFYEYLIRSRSIQLLHIHHATSAYQALYHIRRFHPQLKILDTLHIIELPPNSGGYPEFSAAYFDVFMDCHHVISQQLKQFLMQRWLIDSTKIRVIYLNVDSEYFNPDLVVSGTIRTQYNIPESACLIGFIGRLEPQKQPLAFVRMAHLLLERWRQTQQSTELHFIMVGSGLLEQEVIRSLKKYNLESRVHLQGEVIDTRSIYKDCDLLIMPSENEGLALVTYESLAMQTPIVFTDVGAQSELLNTEFLVPYETNISENLAQAAWPLLLNIDKRTETGCTARQYILNHHQAQDTFVQLLTLYQELLDSNTEEL